MQSTPKIMQAVKDILEYIGDNPNRAGLKDTPLRVCASWNDMFSGYIVNPNTLIKVFDVEEVTLQGTVSQKGIPFLSFCEHHMLPFFGTVNISYNPSKNRRIGLSKLVRVVECFSKRLQVQERLTEQICLALYNSEALSPLSVNVETYSRHLCMECRGVSTVGIITECRAFKDKEVDDYERRLKLQVNQILDPIHREM